MFRTRQVKSICLIIIISIMLMGMCPTGMVADSFFAFSCQPASVQDTTRTVLRSVSSNRMRTVAYTQETLPEQETFLTPGSSLRRVTLRQGNRTCLFLHGVLAISSVYSYTSGNYPGFLLVENFCNMVIVNYIHHQDGAKV